MTPMLHVLLSGAGALTERSNLFEVSLMQTFGLLSIIFYRATSIVGGGQFCKGTSDDCLSRPD